MRKAEGMDQVESENKYNKPSYQPKKKAEPAKAGGKIPKWKLQSMMFRQAMGAGSKDEGGASNFNPSQDMSAQMDDRIECQWCGRKFNEEAGKRHLPHCEEKYKKNQMKNGGKAPVKRGTQAGFLKRK